MAPKNTKHKHGRIQSTRNTSQAVEITAAGDGAVCGGTEDRQEHLAQSQPPSSLPSVRQCLLRTIDCEYSMPCYTSVITDTQCVTMEQLDRLQLELELLLVNAVQRHKQILRAVSQHPHTSSSLVSSSASTVQSVSAVSACERKKRKLTHNNASVSKQRRLYAGAASKQARANRCHTPSTVSAAVDDFTHRCSSSATLSDVTEQSADTTLQCTATPSGDFSTDTVSVQSVQNSADELLDDRKPLLLHSDTADITTDDAVNDVITTQQCIRNEIPDKFWSMVDNYCGRIHTQDLESLKALRKQVEVPSALLHVPALGRHYTLRQQTDGSDIEVEEEDGQGERFTRQYSDDSDLGSEPSSGVTKAATVTAASFAGFHSATSAAVCETRPRGDSSQSEQAAGMSGECRLGACTQKLVSAFVHPPSLQSAAVDGKQPVSERKSPAKSQSADLHETGAPKDTTIRECEGALARALSASRFEYRLRGELHAMGLLGPGDCPAVEEEECCENSSVTCATRCDHVLCELRRCQAELRRVSAVNSQCLDRIELEVAREMSSYPLRDRLKVADKKVQAAYQTMVSCRQNKRTPSARDRQTAWTALEERNSIISELDAIQ